jgi:hypothetical protein
MIEFVALPGPVASNGISATSSSSRQEGSQVMVSFPRLRFHVVGSDDEFLRSQLNDINASGSLKYHYHQYNQLVPAARLQLYTISI